MRISTSARNAVSIILLLLAVVLGTTALAGSAASRFIDTPGPLQRILAPLAVDPQLRVALPAELSTTLVERITEESAIPAILSRPLERAVETASGAFLDTPSFATSWSETIESARADFVTRLDDAAAHPEDTEQVSLRLDVAPLLGTGYETLHSSLAGSSLGALLPQTLNIPSTVLDTGWPHAEQLPTDTVNRWLAVARGWGFFALGAAVAAVLGFFSGVGSGRRWSVLIAGAGTLVLGIGLRVAFASVIASVSGDNAAASSAVESLVTAQLVSGLRGELGSITTILISCGVVTVLGAGGWLWFSARRLAAPRAG